MTANSNNRLRRDISSVLAARITRYIAEQKLPEGTHVPTQDLADRFSVSRSPVNQALRLLCDKGIVRHKPNQGFFVSRAAPSDVTEQMEMKVTGELTDVYFRIAEDHLSGRLEEHVSEQYLRQTYGLTRTQLTQLLSRMSEEGWAERRPGYGWTFSKVLTTSEALEQTYRVRVAIEPAYILEPTFKLNREVAAQCRAVEEWMISGAIDTISADALYERGVRFHETLAAASNNPFFLEALKRINRVRRLLAYRSMGNRERYYSQAREHIRILDLLMQDRNEEASEAMRRHIQSVVKNLRKIKPLLKS
jgi:DNA-binding GntR family transcriptional regulator